ncbi:transposase family protein [Streptomyces sp. SD15]
MLVVSVDASGPVIAVQARTRSRAPAGCAGCGTLSGWVHSRYVRHLADVALGSRPVRIDLSVRRLYCGNSACPKVTFAEQAPGLTVRYQRRTPLLQHWSRRSALCWPAGEGRGCCTFSTSGCRGAPCSRS